MFLFLLLVAAVAPSTVFSQPNCSPNGQLIPLKADSAGFIECVNYKWVNKQCLYEHKFNNNTLKCESIHHPPSSTPPPSPPPPPTCIIGETRQYLSDNTKFELCFDGYSWRLESCPSDNVYGNGQCRSSKTTTRTTPYYTTTTTTKAPPTFDSGRCTESAGASGFKPDPNDCTKYYQCVHGYWMQRPCGPGTAWDQYNLTCNHYYLVCKTGNSQQKPITNPNQFKV